jgi:hypothetical protein
VNQSRTIGLDYCKIDDIDDRTDGRRIPSAVVYKLIVILIIIVTSSIYTHLLTIFTEMSSKAARRAKFEGIFYVIRDEILANCQRENMPPEAITWFQKVCACPEFPRVFSVMSLHLIEPRAQCPGG